MTISNNQIAMTQTVATIVNSNTTRKRLRIENIGTNTVYIGGSGLTAANGYPLEPNEFIEFPDYTNIVYGICATGLTSTVSYFQEA